MALSDPGRALRQPYAHFAGWAAWSGRRPEAAAEAGLAGWGVLWGHSGPSAAFARSPSNLTEQVWEADGDIYWLSWLIICPARRPGELFGGSGELGEAVPDH